VTKTKDENTYSCCFFTKIPENLIEKITQTKNNLSLFMSYTLIITLRNKLKFIEKCWKENRWFEKYFSRWERCRWPFFAISSQSQALNNQSSYKITHRWTQIKSVFHLLTWESVLETERELRKMVNGIVFCVKNTFRITYSPSSIFQWILICCVVLWLINIVCGLCTSWIIDKKTLNTQHLCRAVQKVRLEK